MIRQLPVPHDLGEDVRTALMVDVPAPRKTIIPGSGKTYLIIPGTLSTGFRGDLAFLSGPPTTPFILPAVLGRHAFVAVEFTLAGQFALFGDAVTRDGRCLVHDVCALPDAFSDPLTTLSDLIRQRSGANYRELRTVRHLDRVPLKTSVAGMARETGVSLATLRRHVGRVCGRSPHRLLFEQRLADTFRAVYDHPDIDLSTLAHQRRFADHAHLTRSFRTFSGEPPSRLDRDAFALARGMYGPR